MSDSDGSGSDRPHVGLPDPTRSQWTRSLGEPAPTEDQPPGHAAGAGGDWSGRDEVHDLERLGEAIGPYTLLSKIGEGGFGTVWLAERREPFVQRVALKVVKPGMDSKSVIARFEQERQALAVMDHPHVAKVLDGGLTPQGRPYFAMEFVKGEPITAYADRSRLTIRQRLELFIPVCEAVQHAHHKGLIHRDIKPSNVLVAEIDGKPVPKVIDFGVAKAIASAGWANAAHTQSGAVIGTPEYMSPEQVSGEIDVDTRTDVYSLGVLLYEMLTGELPFDSRELRQAALVEIARIIREVTPPKPSTRLAQLAGDRTATISQARSASSERLTSELRRELDWIPLMALRKERDRRYASPQALADDIRRHLEGRPLLAAPDSRAYLARKFVRRNKVQVLAAGAVFAALTGGLALALWQRSEAIAAKESESIQRARADERAIAAERAERAERDRADQLKKVSDFQSEMLGQIDTTIAGEALMKDVRERFAEALEKAGVPEAERTRRVDALRQELVRVNATDTAAAMIDRTILRPAVTTIDEQFTDDPETDASLRQSLADLYRTIGLYDAALPLQESALATRRRVLGENHPDTLDSMHNRGVLFSNQGDLAGAEQQLREALEKGRRVLGPEHPDTLVSLDNLAAVLLSQGRFAEAEPFCRESIEKSRRVLGEEHPNTLASIHTMGVLLFLQGDFAEAEPYWREALEKRRRVLGEEHPETLISIGDLGILLSDQGRLAEAEPYYLEALEKRRRVLGEAHPDTLISLNNMGMLLSDQGRLAEAESYYRETLEQGRRALGEEHPDTLTFINNVGSVLRSQGKFAEAEPYLLEALEKRRRTLGEEHPSTLISISNMGALLRLQGKFEEAEPYYLEALETSRRVMGEEHPDTIDAIDRMGDLLEAQGKLSEAEPYWREAVEKGRRVLGADHPGMLNHLNNLGFLLRSQGKFAEAEPYYLEALEKRRRLLGEEHPSTLVSISNMGALLAAQGKFAEAEPFLREVLEKRRRVLGEEHASTLASIGNLAAVLSAQGKLEEAERHDLEVLENRRRVLGEEHLDTLFSLGRVLGLQLDQGRARQALELGLPFESAARKGFAGGSAWRLADFLAALGQARVGVGYEAERFKLAESNLLEAHAISVAAPERGPSHEDTLEVVRAVVDLYTAWDAAAPGDGHDAKAAEWRARLVVEDGGSGR